MSDSSSQTGATLAFFVDLMLVLVICFGPFFLPWVARYDPKIRVAAAIARFGLSSIGGEESIEPDRREQ